jgi:hypothetical protein
MTMRKLFSLIGAVLLLATASDAQTVANRPTYSGEGAPADLRPTCNSGDRFIDTSAKLAYTCTDPTNETAANRWSQDGGSSGGAGSFSDQYTVTGSELVVDGNLATDPTMSGWTLGGDTSWSPGSVTSVYAGGDPTVTTNAFSVTMGHFYLVSFTLSGVVGAGPNFYSNGGRLTSYSPAIPNGDFSVVVYGKSTGSDSLVIDDHDYSMDDAWTVSNVSVKEVDLSPAFTDGRINIINSVSRHQGIFSDFKLEVRTPLLRVGQSDAAPELLFNADGLSVFGGANPDAASVLSVFDSTTFPGDATNYYSAFVYQLMNANGHVITNQSGMSVTAGVTDTTGGASFTGYSAAYSGIFGISGNATTASPVAAVAVYYADVQQASGGPKSHAAQVSGFYAPTFETFPWNGTRGTDTVMVFWSGDQAGTATNVYYSWFDSRGVGRCKEDSSFDSVGQSICVVYNPQFTKYTPGASNYERIVYGQWDGNVAEMGPEKGGTGTERDLKLLGAHLKIKSITACPSGQTAPLSIDENGNVVKGSCS